jgi:hypothetical protein
MSNFLMDKFDSLIIPRSTVESLSHQEIGDFMVGFTWRKNLWQQPHKLIQLGAIQLVGAAIILMVAAIPLDRILSIRTPTMTPTERISQLLLVDGILTLSILGGINLWIRDRGKRLQKLLRLVEKIERYNQIVRSIETLVRVTSLTTPNIDEDRITIVLDILTQTRHNLLAALEIDFYLRNQDHSTILTTAFIESAPSEIAHNLIALQQLAQQPQLAEYATLLNQAWEIGLSIDRELYR